MASILLGAILFFFLFALWDNGAFLPRWIRWENDELASDLFEVTLKHRQIHVTANGAAVWTSPKTLLVQNILCSDMDRDGFEELIVLCWKKGRYGKHRPFWVEQDETAWSQHIFIYEYSDGAIRPKWGSSYIGQDVQTITIQTLQNGCSYLLLTAPDKTISSWRWDSWGFTRENTEVSFAVFGDNLIHEPIYRYGLNHGANFDFLFENIRDTLAESDIAVINQETPLVKNPSSYSDYPRFGTPIEVGQAIADAGFDIVTCATNHALDQGASGIQTTWDLFKENGVACLGIQPESVTQYEPCTVITRSRLRFAMLNYTYGTNGILPPENTPDIVHLLKNEEQIRADIKAARAAADMVILFVHWGTENTAEINDCQKKWTQLFLESGVDIVIGTHPHTIQPYELLTSENGHRMLVFYSIGNYISAQSEKTSRKGGAALFTVSLTADGPAVTDYSLRPLVITAEHEGRYTVDFDEP